MALPVSACTPVDNPIRAIAYNEPLVLACWGSEGDYRRFSRVGVVFSGCDLHSCDNLKPDSGRDSVAVHLGPICVNNVHGEYLPSAVPMVARFSRQVFIEFSHSAPPRSLNTQHAAFCNVCNSDATDSIATIELLPPCNSANSPAGLTAGGISLEGV